MIRRQLIPVLVAVLVMACGGPTPTPGPIGSDPPASAAPSTSPVTILGDLPPEAALLVRDGDPVIGQLGGYTWGDTGSDAPWLPGTPATVDGARSLRFALSFEVPVDDWSARYAPAGDLSPTVSTPLDIGGASLEVEPPAAGRWSLSLTITFGEGLGSATYYWQIEVP